MNRIRLLIPAQLGALALALGGPATALALEAPVTEAASGVGATEATVHAELNPGASATAGYQFDYNQGASCEGAATEVQPEQTGQAIKVSSLLTGLVPSAEYTFCAVATHSEGEAFESVLGAPLSFTTQSLAPAVDAEGASGVTQLAATLEAQVNAENEPTKSCLFEYGTTTVYGSTLPCEPWTLQGFGDQTVAHRVEGLAPATTYHFRVVVTNATGTTEGSDSEFTTPALEAPSVDGESAGEVTANDAQLQASINPNYQETTYEFEYATDEALTEPTTVAGAGPIGAGFGDQAVGVDLGSALEPGVTYFYRAIAHNGAGTTEGPVRSFTTIAAPIVTAGTASAITRASALLSGATVNPGGAPVSFSYRYIDQAGYERGLAEDPADPYAQGAITLPARTLEGNSTVDPTPAIAISELEPSTTYHFALVATNSAGTTIGPDATFTTAAPTPPGAAVEAATQVTHSSATIPASVEPDGLETTWQLQLASEPGAFATVASGSLEGSAGPTALTLGLSFLAPGVTYHYRLVATNQDGTATSSEGAFATEAFPTPQGLPPARALVPFTPIAVLDAKEPQGGGGSSHALTRKQKLKRALKACKRKPKSQRAACERRAHKAFGARKR